MSSSTNSTITILQLTRFGDLLQSIWAVKDIKKSNPELKLNLVARKRFAKPLLFLLERYFDNIYLIDQESFKSSDITEGLDKTLESIDKWNTNVLVNLSFSKSSAYLATLLKANFKLGLTSNEHGATIVNGAWSDYVYSTVMRGPLNPFSLIDIFRFIVGVKQKATLPKRSIAGNQIIVHPFASQERKHWSSSKWSEILFKILKKNPEINILIVGSKKDQAGAEEITRNPLLASCSDRLNIKCGSLSLEALHSELENSFLFCGHDSMVGHMASLAGTQCLTLSLGSVRPHETSPYGVNNYILAPKTSCFPCFPDEKCSSYSCHKDLSYQIVTECLQQLIDTNSIDVKVMKKNTSPLHLSNTSLFQSGFSENGIYFLKNISSCDISTKELYNTFYKIVWLFLLEEIEEVSGYPSLNAGSVHSLESFIPNLKQLFELAEFGKKYSRFILEEVSKSEPDISYIKSCGVKIEEIDEMQTLLGKASPVLNPIIDFFNLKKSKMAGANLVELCSSSHEIYQGIASFCDIYYELAEKCLNEYYINNKKPLIKEAKE